MTTAAWKLYREIDPTHLHFSIDLVAYGNIDKDVARLTIEI